MASRQVKCINKSDRMNRHERIRNIGGDWGKTSQSSAISDIKNGIHTYHVRVGSNDVRVIVASHLGNEYLKTEADTTLTDNLLSLPECP